jgi:hypothetical protein
MHNENFVNAEVPIENAISNSKILNNNIRCQQ